MLKESKTSRENLFKYYFFKDLRGERETRDSLERDARKKAFKELEEQKKIDEKLKQEEKVIKWL